jgi:hypothetical protein
MHATISIFGVDRVRNINFALNCQLDKASVLDWPAVEYDHFDNDKFSFETTPADDSKFLIASMFDYVNCRGLKPIIGVGAAGETM